MKKRPTTVKAQAKVKAQAARPPGARRTDAALIPGSSVHASLANEIGLRIVRGDYPP
ncbi:MAG: FadR family transcriptional regulator, partial [Mesorhizobium sp.]